MNLKTPQIFCFYNMIEHQQKMCDCATAGIRLKFKSLCCQGSREQLREFFAEYDNTCRYPVFTRSDLLVNAIIAIHRDNFDALQFIVEERLCSRDMEGRESLLTSAANLNKLEFVRYLIDGGGADAASLVGTSAMLHHEDIRNFVNSKLEEIKADRLERQEAAIRFHAEKQKELAQTLGLNQSDFRATP
jgi:hypothetical protein